MNTLHASRRLVLLFFAAVVLALHQERARTTAEQDDSRVSIASSEENAIGVLEEDTMESTGSLEHLANGAWREIVFSEAPAGGQRDDVTEENKRRRLAVGDGYWSTNKNRIVDANGDLVYFAGINWDGFEYEQCVVYGLQPPYNLTIEDHIRKMQSAGFNLIRLPFAGTCVQNDSFPDQTWINYDVNPGLQGLSSFEVLQRVVNTSRDMGMKVILDFHRIGPPFFPIYGDEFGLWHNATYPLSFWLDTWKFVVEAFVGDSTVVGVDLFNEPHQDISHGGPFWLPDNREGGANGTNWKAAAELAGNMILSINPHLLICVEGIDNNTGYAENLQGARDYPIQLNVSNKLVYSVHDYGPALRVQPWDNTNFPAGLPAFWDNWWGFIDTEQIAPIWVGEFGSLYNQSKASIIVNEKEWLTAFVTYIHNHSLVWSWFDWTPDAENLGGILSDDWVTLRQDKLDAISSIMHPNFGFPAPIPPPPFPPPSPPYSSSNLTYTTPPTAGSLAPIGGYSSPPPPPPPGGGVTAPPGSGSNSAQHRWPCRTPGSIFAFICVIMLTYYGLFQVR